MIILDTNVVSALMRNSPEPDVAKWLDRQPPSSIWTTSITILEIGVGLPESFQRAESRRSYLKGLKDC